MSEQELKIVVLGEAGVGKSTLVVQYVAGVFVEKYDPTIEDSYRKRHTFSGTKDDSITIEILDTAGTYGFSAMRDLYVKQGEAFVFAIPLVLPAAHESYIAQEVALVRRVKKLPPSASTPGMLVGTKADLPWDPDRRSSLITLAARMQLWGYCETSAKTNTNINLLFNELAIHTLLAQGVRSERALGLKAALPWNWGKSKTSKYVSATKTASVPPQLTEAAITKFRFPDPLMTRSPVAFFTDLRRLLEESAGRALADVALTVPDAAESLATHRVVLFLRSEFFRDKLSRSEVVQPIVVPGVTMKTLQYVLHYLYADELPPQLTHEVLDALQEAAINLMLVDLVTLIRERLAQPPLERVLASSDSVQRQTKPYISADAFKQLADVEVVVSDSKQVFRLHRALLWARSEWFRALLERWMHGPCNNERRALELSSMSGDVLACIVEFLYTGRATIPEELAMDVLVAANMINLPRLVQLAEFALKPVAASAESAVAVFLAAQAHRATQLMAMCEHSMAMDLVAAKSSEGWTELSEEVCARVRIEHGRLEVEKARRRETRHLMQKMSCILVP